MLSQNTIKKRLILIIFTSVILTNSGCLGAIWTGADLIYDKNSYANKINDYELTNTVSQRLITLSLLDQSNNLIDYTVFNGDILLAGHVLNHASKKLANRIIYGLDNYRQFYNMLTIGEKPNTEFTDSLITANIRKEIFIDNDILPKNIKIITADLNVYLLGDLPVNQSEKIERIAKNTYNVNAVFNLIHTYTVSPQKLH